MKRRNDRRCKRNDLLKERLHGLAVLAANIEIVTARLAGPVAVFFAEPAALGQRAELAERVGGEKDLLPFLESDHDLRPVHHRRHQEPQGMRPEREGFPFLDGQGPAGIILSGERGEHLEGFRRGDKGQAGIPGHRLRNEPGMVRLHVLDDKIVGPAAAERLREVRHPGRPAAGIDRVHYGNLLIQDDIRIVRHPFRLFPQ